MAMHIINRETRNVYRLVLLILYYKKQNVSLVNMLHMIMELIC